MVKTKKVVASNHKRKRKNYHSESVESEEETTNVEEDLLKSFENEGEDSSDAENDDDYEASDEDDDKLVYETDDEENESSEDSGASSLDDESTKDNARSSSESDHSEYGSDEEVEDDTEEDVGSIESSSKNNVHEVKQTKSLRRKKMTSKQKKIKNKGILRETVKRTKNINKYNFGLNKSDEDDDEIPLFRIKKNNDLSEQELNKTVQENEAQEKDVQENEAQENEAQENEAEENEAQEKTEIRTSQEDEYKSDSSDEEDIRNTVGNVPMNWYDDYNHLGYDWEGKRILKPVKEDQIDYFLKRMEDPDFWRTVKDHQTGQDVVLSQQDVELIQRIQSQKIPDPNFDDTEPYVEWFTSEVMKTPIVRVPDHKRSFLPSKVEARKIAKMVHSLKMGWMKTKAEMVKSREPKFYMLWNTDDGVEHMRRIWNHIPAPKRQLPGHAESYNPPREYLLDSKEMHQWMKLEQTPWKRKLHFLPQKYASLNAVPAYERYIKERFNRCLDLYLCPRARKMRLTIEPEDLLPQLPNPKDLQPFPTVMSIVYEGHTDMVRAIAVEPKGQYLVSGSDDLTLKVWEIATGRCVRTIPVGGVVRSVSWCPNQALSLIAVAADRKVLLINPGVGDQLLCSKTDSLLDEPPKQDFEVPERVSAAVQWEQAVDENWKKGIRVIINHFKEVKQVTWHGRGDYFATVMPDGQNRSVIIHQLSKRRSQVPFSRSKGQVQCVLFHPIRPFFFVATQKNVRVYDLSKQEMIKKLKSNSKWISSMAIHPAGDNLLVATYDRKMLWFDLDLSTEPYQTLRTHGTAVRGVAYHKHYPLFASGSDDQSLIVYHGMVYNDLLQNPLLVPLKRLSSHEKYDDFGIFDVVFHPLQPWVFSSGADKTIRLYT